MTLPSTLASGNLEQLDLLTQQADHLHNAQERRIQDSEYLGDLRRELLMLRGRIGELKQELTNSSRSPGADGSLQADILAELQQIGGDADEIETQEAVVEVKQQLGNEAISDLKKQKFIDVTVAYRLAGQTIFSANGGEFLGIRLETSYLDQYFERYYVFLDFVDDELSIYRHTVPWFIPLASLRDKYLNKDIGKFLEVLGDHLNSFVARREQVRAVVRRYPDICVASPDYTLVEIKADKNKQPGQDDSPIMLQYDLLSTVPVRTSFTDDPAMNNVFLSKTSRLLEAYETYCK